MRCTTYTPGLAGMTGIAPICLDFQSSDLTTWSTYRYACLTLTGKDTFGFLVIPTTDPLFACLTIPGWGSWIRTNDNRVKVYCLNLLATPQYMVWIAGFEPATSRTQTACPSQIGPYSDKYLGSTKPRSTLHHL